MPGPPSHRDRSLVLLMCLVPVLVVVGWAFSLPSLALVLMAAGAGLVSVWFGARTLSAGWARQEDLNEQAAALWKTLAPGEPAPSLETELPRALARLGSVVALQARRTSIDLSNLRAVLDGAATPLLATSASGEVLVSNRACEEFFDRAPGSLTGRSIEELFPQAEVLGQHASALAGKARQGQVRIQRPDGPRVYQVLTAPVPLRLGEGESQTGVVVSLRDVTELALAVQLKTDFVANASHELRTPLASIKAAIETLSDGAWDDPTMRGRLTQMISGNVSRLEEMVRDLLDLSRLESSEAPVSIESVSLQELASGLVEDFDSIMRERRLTLALEIDPAAQRLRTDAKLLTLVLKNLIDNAAKFAYEGTAIQLVAMPLPASGDTPQSQPGIRIQVIDQGVGIPITQQQRVFERFFQVDPARTGFAHRRGTGLGLAIVKHAIKALGGNISVESVWKQGTTMTVEIPGCLEPQDGFVTGA